MIGWLVLVVYIIGIPIAGYIGGKHMLRLMDYRDLDVVDYAGAVWIAICTGFLWPAFGALYLAGLGLKHLREKKHQ